MGADSTWAMSLKEATNRWQQNIRTLAGVEDSEVGGKISFFVRHWLA